MSSLDLTKEVQSPSMEYLMAVALCPPNTIQRGETGWFLLVGASRFWPYGTYHLVLIFEFARCASKN